MDRIPEWIEYNLEQWFNETPDFYPHNYKLLDTAVLQWTKYVNQTTETVFGKKKVFKGAKSWGVQI